MRAFGIDLGTTTTAIACIQPDGTWRCIPNQEGQDFTPSVVYFSPTGPIIGQYALDAAPLAPDRVVQEVKRYVGDLDWAWLDQHRWYSASDISALILRKVCTDAAQHLGEPIQYAVISVPASFSDIQRKATLEAAKQAGLQPLWLINEPTAASLAFGYHDLADNDTLLVFDLGGGTFDMTVLRWEAMHLHVLATHGDAHLGGQDWDDLLLHHAAALFISEHGLDPLDDPHAHQQLKHQVIHAKHQLSAQTTISFPVQYREKTSVYTLHQVQFQEMARPLLSQMEQCCEILTPLLPPKTLPFRRIQLVGGSTLMPMIPQWVRQRFPQSRIVQEQPERSVVFGAALQAYLLSQHVAVPNTSASATSVTPHLPNHRGTAMPVTPHLPNHRGTATSVTPHLPDHRETATSVTPHLLDHRGTQGGLPPQAALLPGQTLPRPPSSVLLPSIHDVNTHRLGLVVWQTQGSTTVETLIPRHTPLPCTHHGTYYTAYDSQVTLELHLVEGESSAPNDCISLGILTLQGLPPRPAGQRIDISFTYDVSGLLHIEAFDVNSHQRFRMSWQKPGR